MNRLLSRDCSQVAPLCAARRCEPAKFVHCQSAPMAKKDVSFSLGLGLAGIPLSDRHVFGLAWGAQPAHPREHYRSSGLEHGRVQGLSGRAPRYSPTGEKQCPAPRDPKSFQWNRAVRHHIILS